jgi:hypothetical protein
MFLSSSFFLRYKFEKCADSKKSSNFRKCLKLVKCSDSKNVSNFKIVHILYSFPKIKKVQLRKKVTNMKIAQISKYIENLENVNKVRNFEQLKKPKRNTEKEKRKRNSRKEKTKKKY